MTNKVYDANTIVDYKTAKKFLSEVFGKNWHDRVDVDILNMHNSYNCVLGQLHGDYRDFCEQFFGNRTPALSHHMKDKWPFGVYTTINWEAKILKRRAKRGAK